MRRGRSAGFLVVLAILGAAGAAVSATDSSSPAPHQPTPEEREGLTLVLWLDFGEVRRVPHRAVGIRANCCMPGVTWVRGHVRDIMRDRERHGPFLADFLEGFDATLVVEVDTLVSYAGVLTLGDAERSRGPVSIEINGTPLVEGLVTSPAGFTDVPFAFSSGDGRLVVRFMAEGCSTFAVNGLALYRQADPDVKRWTRWGARAQAPARSAPDVEGNPLDAFGPALQREPALETLGSYCDYLMANRTSDGSFSFRGIWYENSFSIRTLLAGGTLLGRDDYREAALRSLDRFVEEQQPDGNWSAQFFGRASCPEAREVIRDPVTTNLADLGTMAFCLALAASRTDPERRTRYLDAARDYADRVVMPSQLESGAFPNLLYEGRMMESPYSVATGVQAAFLAALSEATEESDYRAAAERAGMFLASNVDTGGTVVFHPADRRRSNVVSPGDFGDLFYVVDGLLWVRHVTREEPIRKAVDITLEDYVLGSRGLLTWIDEASWWYTESAWQGSKRAAILYVFSTIRAEGILDLRDLPERILAMFEDPRYRPFLILTDPLDPADGEYGLPATALAGLGIASLLDPGVAFSRAR